MHVLKLAVVCIMRDIHVFFVYEVEEEELKSADEVQQSKSISEVDRLKQEIQNLKEKLGSQQRTG